MGFISPTRPALTAPPPRGSPCSPPPTSGRPPNPPPASPAARPRPSPNPKPDVSSSTPASAAAGVHGRLRRPADGRTGRPWKRWIRAAASASASEGSSSLANAEGAHLEERNFYVSYPFLPGAEDYHARGHLLCGGLLFSMHTKGSSS
ncbi:uncharacterized protein LOC127783096 [Oryza glaberrima]|uniref:uncharacterized protein LOC127783096 n=1 Tax=Oryza glaberrima TaxID=4538 RepID=UPI00224C367D|nr:uncharacterized protein LOC127783096 [Oryza glaberrima]